MACTAQGKRQLLQRAKGNHVPELVSFRQQLAVAAFNTLQSFYDFIEHFCLSFEVIIVIFDLLSIPPVLTQALCVRSYLSLAAQRTLEAANIVTP